MNESVIIQKLIQVGQMLERGELEYSGAEIDTKHYLEQYAALRQPPVMGSVCDGCGSKFNAMDISVGVCYCCQKEIKRTDL